VPAAPQSTELRTTLRRHYPGLAVSFIAELGLGLCLLAKGVKVIDSGAGLPGEKRDTDPQAERTQR
jgi:hypothetical protein